MIDLSKLTTEELIKLYERSSSQDDGAQYYIDLAKSKGWW